MKKAGIAALLFFTISTLVFAQLPQDGLKGHWNFDNSSNLVQAVVGNNLILEAMSGVAPSQQAVEGPISGDGAVSLPLGVYYRCNHSIGANGGGTKVNQYTLVFDFKKPVLGTWSNFFSSNTDVTADDGECFINTTNNIGVGLTGYSAEVVRTTDWYRLIIVADLGNSYNYYLDGQLILVGGAQELDGRFALSPSGEANSILFFGDNDGEDSPMNIAQIALYDRALTAAEVEQIGGYYHEPVIIPVAERLPFIQIPDTSSVNIAWRTADKFLGKVEYGTTTSLGNTVFEDSSVNKHIVFIDNLTPNTKYYYRVSNDNTVFYESGYFYTAKPDNIKQVTFLIWGDSGVNTNLQYKIAGLMEKETFDFGVHVGDVNQHVGEEYDLTYFQPYKNIVTSKNVYTCLGNHDTYTENGGIYLDAFYLPHNNAANTEKYYSYRWGNVFGIVLDTEIDYSPSSPQYKFLVDALQSDRKKSATWTVVSYHRPAYCEFWDTYDGEEDVRNYLLPLFEKNGVDLIFNGHTHAYEHGFLNGIHYVITGGAGGGLDTYGRDWPQTITSIAAFHYSKVEVNDKELLFTAIDLNGRVLDSFNISKNPSSVDGNDIVPADFSLEQNYPNPFNPSTKIKFSVDEKQFTTLKVFDILGKEIAILVNEEKNPGVYEVEFMPGNNSSGVYFCQLSGTNSVRSMKMIYLK